MPRGSRPNSLARVNNKATCTAEGAAQGKCREGEIIYVEFPELDWTIESPIPSPTSSNPVMCYRKAYEAQKRDCPTPNQNNSSGRQNGEPLWGTPTGLDADNPLYYDSVTGAPTTCLRTWMQDLNVSCPVGTIFDQTLNGCINELSAECPSGTTYSNGQCIGGDGKQCPTTHYFDEKSSVCTPKLSDPSDFNEQYNSGADLAWAIGGLQSGKVQGANNQGDVTLDMGLLNQEADRELQANKDNFKDVVAIGENDRTHNQYSSIDNTFGNEKEQTTVIQTNHGSYQSYLNDSDPEHPNLAAEAYALVDDNIHKNRPPAIDPSDDWLDSSKDINKGIGDGTDPYFGDCEVGGTKTVLNPDKQIITQESCTKPVTMNFSSCKVQRYIEEPVIKIIEGADKAEVEVIANDTIRITMGEICDNCLNDGGQACKTYTRNVVVQMTKDIGVKKATFTKSLYDDMIVIAADGNEVFRAAKAPWNVSGWPSAGQSCENGTSYTWNGSIDATQQFQEALADDNRIDFNYKIGVGGGGEAHAVVVIQFDQDIRTDWFDEPRYEPENCFDRYTSGECTATGWECDLTMPPNTLGMEDWEEWDGVRNWNITNQGYDARSTQNGAFSAYGSMQNVGNLWFRGDVTVPSDDDDSFGFMIGYPEAPHFNKDPDNADYDPNATDQEYNHYYVLLWTSNHEGSNGSYYGLSFYKSYVPYSTLENRFPSYWGINFHNDMYETDRFGNSVRILDVIHSDRTPWSPGRKYEIEYKQDEFGYVKFWIDDTLRIDIPPELETIKTGRFGFATISLNNVFFEGMEKVVPYDFGPLFPGDSDPSRCVQGHAVDFRCGALSDNGSILGPSGSVWTYDKLQEMDNTCAPLEAREDCSWVKRECVEGFEQPDGSCLAEKEIYNCVDNSNAWEEVPMENTCSVLPCSGGECDHRGEEVNPDFADVVTQIALISEMREYMDCSDPDDINTCQVYKGDQRTCSYDQFGMIDCCEEFKGKTIDFFAVTLNLMTVASFESEMFGIEESMASQAWGSMEGYVPTIDFGINEQDGITAELGQVGQDITDGAKSWIGLEKPQTEKFAEGNETAHGEKSSEESPNDSSGADTDKVFLNWAKEMIKDEIIDEMVAQAIDYIVDLLPEIMQEAMASAGEALFAETVKSQVTDEAAKQAAGAAVEAIAAFMGAVSVAIAVIKIAQAVYQLLNGCDDSEMDMPQVLKEKKCFYSHTRDCDKKFGICMRKYEKKWCCFSSIMSRIIMEQAIYQPQPFGGRAKSKSEWYNNEQCRGLTLAEIPLVDFSSINLDEWYDLMVQSGTLPDGQDTLEEWTKDNSYANPYGRSDSLQLQYDRGVEDFNEEYREVMDRSDVLGEADCSETSNLQGCKTGIFAD
ncbi:conjugal transfer protein TraN [Vibrio sp. Makdt]|uniref:conjugal transfer protein TraN n=1 Tax=Vibrio sp. Makdt TaxID=2998828 RepID=UPI0022CD2730|nr:conjugal transfer protein TraN [Vibrio sp. Makdt]MDA0152410.1 conjugal transfer protein TraN [Vibrio sp. Makdt]